MPTKPDLTNAEQFFYRNAGWSEPPGRVECARQLAAAEARLRGGPYFVAVERDETPWDGDVPYDGPLWMVTLYSVKEDTEPQLVDCVGGVACEQGDDYLRVVAAELALGNIEE